MMLPVLPALMAEHRPGTSGSAAGTSAEGDGGTGTGMPRPAMPGGNVVHAREIWCKSTARSTIGLRDAVPGWC